MNANTRTSRLEPCPISSMKLSLASSKYRFPDVMAIDWAW